jgi:hypothetical protein
MIFREFLLLFCIIAIVILVSILIIDTKIWINSSNENTEIGYLDNNALMNSVENDLDKIDENSDEEMDGELEKTGGNDNSFDIRIQKNIKDEVFYGIDDYIKFSYLINEDYSLLNKAKYVIIDGANLLYSIKVNCARDKLNNIFFYKLKKAVDLCSECFKNKIIFFIIKIDEGFDYRPYNVDKNFLFVEAKGSKKARDDNAVMVVADKIIKSLKDDYIIISRDRYKDFNNIMQSNPELINVYGHNANFYYKLFNNVYNNNFNIVGSWVLRDHLVGYAFINEMEDFMKSSERKYFTDQYKLKKIENRINNQNSFTMWKRYKKYYKEDSNYVIIFRDPDCSDLAKYKKIEKKYKIK